MPQLIFGRLRARGASDRGAVAALVAILLASGVLLGMTAWVVDLGMAYAERDQVLNAAGAAALAGAEHCAKFQSTTCGVVNDLKAVANLNASDGQMSIDSVCGREKDRLRLAACQPDDGGAATRCLTEPPEDLSYVEVHAGTLTADGSRVLPPVFSRATTGHVAGCARVAWGPPKGPYAAIGLSDCAFKALVQRTNGLLAPPPKYRPSALAIQVLPLEAPGGPGDDTCDDAVYYRSRDCHTGASQNGTLSGSVITQPGTRPPPGCEVLVRDKEGAATDDAAPYLLMPIYDSYVRDPGSTDGTATFTIVGIAAFRITGDKLSDDDGVANVLDRGLPAGQFCGPGTTAASRCIRGYLVWANIIDGRLPASGWTTTYGVASYKTVG